MQMKQWHLERAASAWVIRASEGYRLALQFDQPWEIRACNKELMEAKAHYQDVYGKECILQEYAPLVDWTKERVTV